MNSLDDLSDSEIQSRYRLDREGILYLVDLIGAELERKCKRSQSIPPLTQILIGLRYLAKGDFFSEVGDLHGVSKSTVSLVLNNFLDAVNENLNNIRFPMTRREQEKNRVEFYRKCGIPGVLGAIDGTLISIIAPTHQEEAYRCRKGFHALNVQAVTDCNLNVDESQKKESDQG